MSTGVEVSPMVSMDPGTPYVLIVLFMAQDRLLFVTSSKNSKTICMAPLDTSAGRPIEPIVIYLSTLLWTILCAVTEDSFIRMMQIYRID